MFFRHILLLAILLCTLLHASATPILGLSVSRCLGRHCFSPRIPVGPHTSQKNHICLFHSQGAIREFHRPVAALFCSPLITTPGGRSETTESRRGRITRLVPDGLFMVRHFPGDVSDSACLIQVRLYFHAPYHCTDIQGI